MSPDASQVLKALGKSEAMNLLRALDDANDGLRFNQLKGMLNTDAKTLTRRVDELGRFGLTEKGEDSKYHLTPHGRRVLELAHRIEDEVRNDRRSNVAQ